MSPGAPRSVTIALGAGPADASTVAALKLVDAAARRGHDVTVYAYGEAVRLGAATCPAADYVSCLLRDHPGAAEGGPDSSDSDDVVPGRATWIVDGQDPRTATQVDGVRRGDGSDLWRAVRDSDIVLGVTP